MTNKLFYRTLAIAVVPFCVCVVAKAALGQGTASLAGQVTDPSGAGVSSATITAKSADTGVTQSVSSSDTGVYIIYHLNPGNYSLSVTANGFQSYIQNGILLTTGQAGTQDVRLKVGSTQETVSINADAEILNTTNAELGATIGTNEVSQLPVNGRDPSSLV